MPLYLSILQGPDPLQAIPLLSTSNEDLIRCFAELIAQRLGVRVTGNILDMRNLQALQEEGGDDGQ